MASALGQRILDRYAADGTTRTVLDNALERGMITETEHAAAIADPQP